MAKIAEVECRLWDIADALVRTRVYEPPSIRLRSSGLIFLRFADRRFADAGRRLAAGAPAGATIGKADYQARGVLYLPTRPASPTCSSSPRARTSARRINDAMRAIEDENEELNGTSCPRPTRSSTTARSSDCSRHASHPGDIEGDAFGTIYEYFLGKFALTEGQKRRRVLHADVDRPADRRDHRAVPRQDLRPGLRLGRHVRPVAPSSSSAPQRHPDARALDLRPGADRRDRPLCRMNLAVHGLSGDIRQAQQLLRGPPRQRRHGSTS